MDNYIKIETIINSDTLVIEKRTAEDGKEYMFFERKGVARITCPFEDARFNEKDNTMEFNLSESMTKQLEEILGGQ